MSRIASVFVLGAVALLVGCGGENGGSDETTPSEHNEAAIQQAEQAGESVGAARDEVLRRLDAELNLRHYAGLDDTFAIPGGHCSVDDVTTVEELGPYGEPDETDLVSPDGQVVVSINIFVGADTNEPALRAACLQAAKEALGW